MKYSSKEALLADISKEYEGLCRRLEAIERERWEVPDVWGDGWNVKDLVAHLAEWQEMFLTWYRNGLEGRAPEMPAAGFKWNETPRLNREIREKHSRKSVEAVRQSLESGHRQIMEIINDLSPEQLLAPGYFRWTRKYPLTTYIGPNTASHYRFANKVLDRWSRQIGLNRS